MPRSIRSAAIPASRSNSSAVSRRRAETAPRSHSGVVRSSRGSCLTSGSSAASGRVAILELAERVHGEHDVIDAGRNRALDLSGRNPPGAKHKAPAVVKLPVGRDSVAGGVLRDYPRSGGPIPGRPNRRRAHRADRDAGRRARRSRPRAQAERRTPRSGRSLAGLRLLTRNTDTERVPGGISPLSSPLATARDEHVQLEPARLGNGNHNRGFRAGAKPNLELALARDSLPHRHLSLPVAAVRLIRPSRRARTRNRPSAHGP